MTGASTDKISDHTFSASIIGRADYYRSRATRARSAWRCQQVWQLRYIHRDPARPIGCETSRLDDFRERYSQQCTVQCVLAKRNRSVTSGTRHNCESNYAAFSPGAEGNSHAQDYLIRRCRWVGPDWCWNVVWRQNIYCHRRTGWLSRKATRNDDWCKGSAYLAL